jgi:hypothetical protein
MVDPGGKGFLTTADRWRVERLVGWIGSGHYMGSLVQSSGIIVLSYRIAFACVAGGCADGWMDGWMEHVSLDLGRGAGEEEEGRAFPTVHACCISVWFLGGMFGD